MKGAWKSNMLGLSGGVPARPKLIVVQRERLADTHLSEMKEAVKGSVNSH